MAADSSRVVVTGVSRESNLRYRAREYDVAMRYHQDMNFTMIRNWVGQNGEDALYEAGDKYGIVIWQDFWLANPWDGPDPDDNSMFMQNATDLVERIRNHPSVGCTVDVMKVIRPSH